MHVDVAEKRLTVLVVVRANRPGKLRLRSPLSNESNYECQRKREASTTQQCRTSRSDSELSDGYGHHCPSHSETCPILGARERGFLGRSVARIGCVIVPPQSKPFLVHTRRHIKRGNSEPNSGFLDRQFDVVPETLIATQIHLHTSPTFERLE